jgi:hypothetical protein
MFFYWFSFRNSNYKAYGRLEPFCESGIAGQTVSILRFSCKEVRGGRDAHI